MNAVEEQFYYRKRIFAVSGAQTHPQKLIFLLGMMPKFNLLLLTGELQSRDTKLVGFFQKTADLPLPTREPRPGTGWSH